MSIGMQHEFLARTNSPVADCRICGRPRSNSIHTQEPVEETWETAARRNRENVVGDASSVIEKVLKRAKKFEEHPYWLDGSVSYYKVSSRAAGTIMRSVFPGKKLPRPGYAVDMPPSTFQGYRGRWVLTNRGGDYELMFHYA